MSVKLTNEQVKSRIRALYGDSLILDKVDYKNTRLPIIVTCPIHGDFQVFYNNLIHQNCTCPNCKNKNKTKDFGKIFIQKAKEVHNNFYSYDKVVYRKAEEKVIITCPIHGDFEQSPSAHLTGRGCPKCANNYKKDTESFIQKAKEVHNNFYSYDKTNYVDSRTNVIITCPVHGDFEQIAGNHLVGQGCPKCASIRKHNNGLMTKEEFIFKAQQIWKNSDGTPKFDYSKVIYIGSKELVEIICPEHGSFWQRPNNHLTGHDCLCCSNNGSSKAELEISDFINSLGFETIKHKRFNFLDNKEIDIFIPSLNIGIEYDGLYWHSDIYREDSYHKNKTIKCDSNNIRLIHIFENEWLLKKEIVKSRLSQILNKVKFKIPARKCIIKQVSIEDERNFLNTHHLQGYIASRICYGLYYTNPSNNKEYLISLMSFGQLRKNLGQKQIEGIWEMYRFCNLKNFNIQGGASKLFKYFLKQFNPKQIISYADRRWSINNEHTLYNQLGFEFIGYTEPNYFYIDGHGQIINKFQMRKDKLISRAGKKIQMSEREYCNEILGLYRIYDCGNLKYVWNK